jgi:hypothetical protein
MNGLRVVCALAVTLALAIFHWTGAAPAHAAATDLFNNVNTGAVSNGPTVPTTFTLSAAATITQIVTYHSNGGKGAAPGSIGLMNHDQSFGPFPATGAGAQKGQATSWVVTINLSLPPGTYTVTDSDIFTWSYNTQSQGRGFAIVRGTYLSSLCTGAGALLYTNTNNQPVRNGGLPPTFTLQHDGCVTQIATYHWNNGHGATPGTIWLLGQNGVTYGPFQATGVAGQSGATYEPVQAAGAAGQSGAPNVNWVVSVRLGLPAGSYLVDDSDWTTWSSNNQSDGAGFVTVLGYDQG